MDESSIVESMLARGRVAVVCQGGPGFLREKRFLLQLVQSYRGQCYMIGEPNGRVFEVDLSLVYRSTSSYWLTMASVVRFLARFSPSFECIARR